MSKAIEEVTYYCKKCEIPLYDVEVKIKTNPHESGVTVKTGDLKCRKCFKVVEGIKKYI